jgi:hypothetical protein
LKTLEELFIDLTSKEPFFQERVQAATEKARNIVNAEDLSTEETIIARMKYLVSRHFSIPFHSEFFDNLTFDDLVLEVMLISESAKDQPQRSGEVIKENQTEAEDAFGDLMGEDGAESFDVPDEFSAEEKEFLEKQGKDFKQGGFGAVRN